MLASAAATYCRGMPHMRDLLLPLLRPPGALSRVLSWSAKLTCRHCANALGAEGNSRPTQARLMMLRCSVSCERALDWPYGRAAAGDRCTPS